MNHYDQMHANAVSQRAAWVLMPRPLSYSMSDAYRCAAGAEKPAHLFRGQLGACSVWDTRQELGDVSS